MLGAPPAGYQDPLPFPLPPILSPPDTHYHTRLPPDTHYHTRLPPDTHYHTRLPSSDSTLCFLHVTP